MRPWFQFTNHGDLHLQKCLRRFDTYVNDVSRRFIKTIILQVDRLAASFYQIGLQRGDRVGIWAPSGTQFYLSTLAAARAGMISVGINPAYQVPELEYALNKVGVKALIAPESYRSQNYYDMITQIVPELKSWSAGEINSSKVPSLSAVIMKSDRGQTLP